MPITFAVERPFIPGVVYVIQRYCLPSPIVVLCLLVIRGAFTVLYVVAFGGEGGEAATIGGVIMATSETSWRRIYTFLCSTRTPAMSR